MKLCVSSDLLPPNLLPKPDVLQDFYAHEMTKIGEDTVYNIMIYDITDHMRQTIDENLLQEIFRNPENRLYV